jgi:H+/Cl- antiporter ClcA
MKNRNAAHAAQDTLRDFSADRRLLAIAALGIATGTFGACAAWALLRLISLVTHLAYFHTLGTGPYALSHLKLGPLSVLIPVTGGLIVGLMARYGSSKIRGHGIPEALESILTGGSRIEAKVALLKPLSSAVAIGTGGPFGAEGPIIMTGGALGSLLAQCLPLTPAERKTLLVAGAAAGMTAIFGTPVAAVLLAVEVMLFEWKPRSLVPVCVSAVVARAWRPYLVGAWPLFPYTGMPHVPWWGIGACLLVGVLAGALGTLLSAAVYGVEELFEKLPVHWMWWPALGGVLVGLGGLVDPAVLGVGYDNIQALLDGAVPLHAAVQLLIGKALVWIGALSSGTSGGVLAPLLIVGGALGVLEAHLAPFGGPGFWALVAMSATLGGTLRAPLASSVFAVEITGDLRVLPAVLAACAAAYAMTVLIMRRSILTERLARRGRHLSYEYSVDPFSVARVGEIMVEPAHTLPGAMTAQEAFEFFSPEPPIHRHTTYPLVEPDGRITGMVCRADVLRWVHEGAPAERTLRELCGADSALIGHPDEPFADLADRMIHAHRTRAAIVDRTSSQVVGLVGQREILQVRARALREERDRARVL